MLADCLLVLSITALSILTNCRNLLLCGKFLDINLPASLLLFGVWQSGLYLAFSLPPHPWPLQPTWEPCTQLYWDLELSVVFTSGISIAWCLPTTYSQELRLQCASVFLEDSWEGRLHKALAFCISQGHCCPLLCLLYPTHPLLYQATSLPPRHLPNVKNSFKLFTCL